jgi:hypothetical protein
MGAEPSHGNSSVVLIRRYGPGQADPDRILAFAEQALACKMPDEQSLLVAAELLGSVRSDRARSLLRRIMCSDKYLASSGASTVLGQAHGDSALPTIEGALASSNQWERSMATRALGHIGGKRAVELLEKQSQSSDALCREAAINAMKILGGPDAKRILMAMAGPEKDYYMGSTIRAALRELFPDDKDVGALPPPPAR